VVIGFSLVAVPTQSVASPPWYTKKATVIDVKWMKLSTSLCMRVEVKAKVKISFQQWKHFDPGPHRYDLFKYKNPQLLDPVATIKMYEKCNFNKPKSKDGLTAVKVSQFYSIATKAFCSLNPSLKFGLPWAVSLNFSPTCVSGSKSALGTPDPQLILHKSNTYQDKYSGTIGGWPDASGAVYEDESTALCIFPSSNVTLTKPGKNVTKAGVNGTGSTCIGLVRLAQS
jgi:hypothetical protein